MLFFFLKYRIRSLSPPVSTHTAQLSFCSCCDLLVFCSTSSLSIAHCWQRFSFPAGLQSSSLLNSFPQGDQLKTGLLYLHAEKSYCHKFTTWLPKFPSGRVRNPLHCKHMSVWMRRSPCTHPFCSSVGPFTVWTCLSKHGINYVWLY